MLRRARGPLAAPEGETWTCATASPTLVGLEAAFFRSTPDRLTRGSYAPIRISTDKTNQADSFASDKSPVSFFDFRGSGANLVTPAVGAGSLCRRPTETARHRAGTKCSALQSATSQVTPEEVDAVERMPSSKFSAGLMVKLDTRRWNRA